MKYTLLPLFALFSFTIFSQDRNCDPVVLTGTDAACMQGEMPDDIVAFKYQSGNWIQIPIQIDERVLLDISAPYDSVELEDIRMMGNECLRNSTRDTTWNVLFYADSETHTGADTVATFDGDDELVFMSKDAGDQSMATTYPTGTIQGSVCEIAFTDPLEMDAIVGYIYLFLQDGSLDQAAGVDYITYDFTYKSDSIYLDDYIECVIDDPNVNPEESTISTNNYTLGFTRRWQEDLLRIKAGNATEVDILDRHQIFINAGTCGSTEDRFSGSEGAHIAAIDGPIRAIRSVMGAASGPFTHLDILATECQVRYNMFFRLHPANGFNDVYDMSDSARDVLTYYSERNQGGALVDGNAEALDNQDPDEWALYEGTAGSLIISWDYETDMTIDTVGLRYDNGNGPADCDIRAYYDDDGAGASHPCTGDGFAYGSSGFTLRTKQCTDYRYDNNNQYPECRSTPFFFNIERVHYMKPPGMTIDSAEQYDQYVKNPLQFTVIDGVGVDVGMSTCPPMENFMNQTISTDSTYLAADSITTENMVEISSGTAVTFSAGELVRLKPGFIVNNGATFTAKIGGCTPAANREIEQRLEAQITDNQWKIYPNPSRGQATIEYKLAEASPVHTYLIDLNGKVLKTLLNHHLQQAGNYQQNIDLSNFNSGIYIIIFQSKSGLESRKISIMK